MPLVRGVQWTLCKNGRGLFRYFAMPEIVQRILRELYLNTDAIDNMLVTVLLDPLLTEGANNVVFDMLSYSLGRLLKQQLWSKDFPSNCPVLVVYGTDNRGTTQRDQSLHKLIT